MIFDISSAKTGTTSLCKALSVLGFNSCHGCPAKYEEDTISKLLQNNMNLNLFKDFDAVCGLLNFAYYQLEKAYPRAKFIYLDRDESDWAKSTIYQLSSVDHSQTTKIDNFTIFHYARLQNIGCLHTNDKEFLVQKFLQRKKAIIEHFSNQKNKLLIMSIKEGWKPLCSFLEKDVPIERFPRMNVSKAKFI